MENLIYQNGVAIGMDCGDYISWFSSAFANGTKDQERPLCANDWLVQNPPSDQLEAPL